MKPKFSTLVILTFVAVAILAPFALSPIYLPIVRENAFDVHLFLHSELYKQATGYTSLLFIAFEMLLTARKRGRGWLVKLSVPGSMPLWRSLHIFLGVALLGTTLVHTVGSTGDNFNGVFLWVFFAVTLSALVGVVTETGIVESPRRYFGAPPSKDEQPKLGLVSVMPHLPKGKLIRTLRTIWLPTHIFLVAVFIVMLGIHIFLAYYYQ